MTTSKREKRRQTRRAIATALPRCNVCPAFADVAQLVEQRFRKPKFAPRRTFAPSARWFFSPLLTALDHAVVYLFDSILLAQLGITFGKASR